MTQIRADNIVPQDFDGVRDRHMDIKLVWDMMQKRMDLSRTM
jgi:hypothetical protein